MIVFIEFFQNILNISLNVHGTKLETNKNANLIYFPWFGENVDITYIYQIIKHEFIDIYELQCYHLKG